MKVDEFINKEKVLKYYILDSHDKGESGQLGNTYADEDYIRYCYNPSVNDRLIPGTAFL